LEWLAWFNKHRPLAPVGYTPPADPLLITTITVGASNKRSALQRRSHNFEHSYHTTQQSMAVITYIVFDLMAIATWLKVHVFHQC
jgi:hypothetical protein